MSRPKKFHCHNQQSKVSTIHQNLQYSALLLQGALDGLNVVLRGCYQQNNTVQNCFAKARILNDGQLRAQDDRDDAFIQQH